MYPCDFFLLSVLLGLAVAQRHLDFKDPWESLRFQEKARAFKKTLEDVQQTKNIFDVKDFYDSAFDGGLKLLQARENARNRILQFIDPVNGGRQFFQYNPIPRREAIASYYRREGPKLSELSIFPGQSSFSDDDGHNDKPFFNTPQDNSYHLDNKFFSTFKRNRQNKFIRGNKRIIRLPSRTSLRVKPYPLTSFWDNIIMYLLQSWDVHH